MWLNQLIKGALRARGLTLVRTANLPFGVSLSLDLHRLGMRDRPVIFDVGAHTGTFSAQLAKDFPHGRFYLFEPTPETFVRIPIKKGFRRLNYGLSDVSGQRTLHAYDGADEVTNSFVAPSNDKKQDLARRLIVQSKTLDEAATELAVERIDLLKIDVEGAEMEVLQGGNNTIRAKVEAVYVECEFHRNIDNHTSFLELYDHLSKAGFLFVTLYTEEVRRDMGFVFGSALFMHRRWIAAAS